MVCFGVNIVHVSVFEIVSHNYCELFIFEHRCLKTVVDE